MKGRRRCRRRLPEFVGECRKPLLVDVAEEFERDVGLFGLDEIQPRRVRELGLEVGDRFREIVREVDADEQSHTGARTRTVFNAAVDAVAYRYGLSSVSFAGTAPRSTVASADRYSVPYEGRIGTPITESVLRPRDPRAVRRTASRAVRGDVGFDERREDEHEPGEDDQRGRPKEVRLRQEGVAIADDPFGEPIEQTEPDAGRDKQRSEFEDAVWDEPHDDVIETGLADERADDVPDDDSVEQHDSCGEHAHRERADDR